MWSKIPSFEAKRPPSRINYDQSSIHRGKHDAEFRQQLKNIRLMGVKLADANRKIGNKIFKNAQSERRQRKLPKPFEKYDEPTRQPTYDFSSRKSADSSCYSLSCRSPLFGKSFDFLNTDDYISSASYSTDILRVGLPFATRTYADVPLSQLSDNSLYSQSCGDAETNYISNDPWTGLFDDESSFEFIGSKPKSDTLALTDMLRSLFGSDNIHRYPARKLPPVPVNAKKRPLKFNSDRKSSFASISNRKKLSNSDVRKPSNSDVRKPSNSDVRKRVNKRNVVDVILDSIITDAENSVELLK